MTESRVRAMLELAEIWKRAAVNNAYRISDTAHVSNRMPVFEMFKVAAALRARAADTPKVTP